VLDVQGEQILRTSTGDLGVILPSSVIALGIIGLDVRVRVITSDGMRSDWSRLLTGPLPTAIIPRPTGLEVVESGTGAAAVRWDYPSMNQSTSSRFEVTISQPEPGLSRSLEVDDSGLFEFTGIPAPGEYVLRVRRIGSIKDGDEVIGNETRVKVVKNKVAPPFRQTEFQIMYGKGIYRMGEIIDLGVKLNLLDKSGAWYAYKGEKVGQGKKNVATDLEENPAMAKEIEEQIRAQLLGGANNLLIAADVENAEVGLD
jgi:hypothetical protein